MTDLSGGPVKETNPTRDSLRSSIFQTRAVKKEIIDFFGSKIEIRQPTLSDIIKARETDDREAAVIQTLIDYAYVPGSEEKVFESGDVASFKQMPFGADFLRVSNALEKLTEVNFLDKSGDSNNDRTNTNSTK